MSEHITEAFLAAEDFNTEADQYLAVAFDDRKRANNGLEARGIIQTKPKSGEHGTVILQGKSQFRAGGAVSAGARLTVATSGYFTAAASGDWVVGANLVDAVTSGSIGDGFFNFTPFYMSTSN